MHDGAVVHRRAFSTACTRVVTTGEATPSAKRALPALETCVESAATRQRVERTQQRPPPADSTLAYIVDRSLHAPSTTVGPQPSPMSSADYEGRPCTSGHHCSSAGWAEASVIPPPATDTPAHATSAWVTASPAAASDAVHLANAQSGEAPASDAAITAAPEEAGAEKPAAELVVVTPSSLLPHDITTAEIEIPGILVGVIIGRGGESIKRLMEASNTKMQMIAKQDNR